MDCDRLDRVAVEGTWVTRKDRTVPTQGSRAVFKLESRKKVQRGNRIGSDKDSCHDDHDLFRCSCGVFLHLLIAFSHPRQP
jgi:hypothetical protein